MKGGKKDDNEGVLRKAFEENESMRYQRVARLSLHLAFGCKSQTIEAIEIRWSKSSCRNRRW